MDVIKQGILLLMTPQCFDKYFIELNFFDVDCFKSTLSKCLGFGIILGSILVKLPQILKILKNKSGQGINILSTTLDLCAITIYMSYNFVKGFPFSSYGDSAFLAVQTVIIGALVLHYGGYQAQSFLYIIAYGIVVFVLAGGVTPEKVLWTLQGFNIPILLAGKLAQAYTNFKNGSTGQLSAITLFMLFFGSLARIFTSIQETGDSMNITTYSFSSFANGVLVCQLIYYWNSDKVKVQKKVN